MRKSLGLFSNVRPCVSFHPYVSTKHPIMDVVIIRENEEDVYAGIEHQQTDEVVQCLKLISRPGCEKIIRYAFEYAKCNGRKKVTCFTKDNIMKQTDGLFRKIFNEIATEYPDIINEHWIVDIGAAMLAQTPEVFDVIVMPNLYGDILSDVAAQITGSVGMAGSANIGQECAMFEAIHGTAPDIAGKNIANPSGLIQASVMMLNHMGQADVASRIQNAWLKTIEDGVHTGDIYKAEISIRRASTEEFTAAVIGNLGLKPKSLKATDFSSSLTISIPQYVRKPQAKKELVGCDVFVHWSGLEADILASIINNITLDNSELTMITNRGIVVWPSGFEETFCTDHWRCRFIKKEGAHFDHSSIVELLDSAIKIGIETIKTENLYYFNGSPGFSLGQGQK